MNELINEKVSVITSYNRENGLVMPKKFRWQGRDYIVSKLAYHRKTREGMIIFHTFYVSNGSMDFCLKLNTDNLQWILEEVTDGATN